jgi:hypothetical protein
MNMIVYWISIIFIDFVKFICLIILIYPFLIWKNGSLFYSLIIVIFFILSCCLFNYVLSHLFSEELSGQKFSLLINYLLFLGLIGLDVAINKNELNPSNINNNSNHFYFSDLCPSSQFGLSLYRLT